MSKSSNSDDNFKTPKKEKNKRKRIKPFRKFIEDDEDGVASLVPIKSRNR